MSSRLPRAVLSVCVRLQPAAREANSTDQRAVDATAERLLESLVRRQIPATWAVADPANSAVAKRMMTLLGGQEIALLIDEAVFDATGSGSVEIARRVLQGRVLGLRLATVAVTRALDDCHYEALARLGVAGVCSPRAQQAARRHSQPAIPRFGLWCYSDSVSLPGTSRWAAGGGGLSAARREVSLAIGEQGLVQIGIDLPAMARRGRAAERVVERVIDLAERRRGIGKLDIITLENVAVRLLGHYAGKPSRSILRPAA